MPAPAGSYVIHYANKVHYDGAKNEETIIQVWGMGPATSTPIVYGAPIGVQATIRASPVSRSQSARSAATWVGERPAPAARMHERPGNARELSR